MTDKSVLSVPFSAKEVAQLREIARARGISEDEAATHLVQAGLAGIAKARPRKKGKILGMKRRSKG